jgi:hypothetical protein
MAKINSVLFPIFIRDSLFSELLYLEKEKNIETPTTNRKKGKTKSVGVHPCQLECSKGAKMCPQLPGVFTVIMVAMVMPLRTSSAR